MSRGRKIQSPSELALEIFRHWSKEDINFLREFLNELLEPPQPPSQKLPLGKCGGGYVELKRVNGRLYRYYRYTHQGKRRSLYLGKHLDEPPAGLEGLAAIHRRNF